MRNLLWNIIMLMRSRSACATDLSGVTAAAYAICLQVYYVGAVFGSAMQVCATRRPRAAPARTTRATSPCLTPTRADRGLIAQGTASILVAGALTNSPGDARVVAGRCLAWGWRIGAFVSFLTLLAIPVVIPLFTPLASVREAIYGPMIAAALVHLSSGVCYASEGIAMGLGAWGVLAKATFIGLLTMAAGLQISSLAGLGVVGTHVSVWASMGVMNAVIPIVIGMQLYGNPLLVPAPVPTSPAVDEVAAVEAVAMGTSSGTTRYGVFR